jgi:tetratricopeptide (TPR) repeat protein
LDEREKGILLRCARIYVITKNWPKAISEYEPIVKNFPDDPNVQEQVGLCYKGNNEKAKALMHFKEALRLELALGRAEKAERLKLKITECEAMPD